MAEYYNSMQAGLVQVSKPVGPDLNNLEICQVHLPSAIWNCGQRNLLVLRNIALFMIFLSIRLCFIGKTLRYPWTHFDLNYFILWKSRVDVHIERLLIKLLIIKTWVLVISLCINIVKSSIALRHLKLG